MSKLNINSKKPFRENSRKWIQNIQNSLVSTLIYKERTHKNIVTSRKFLIQSFIIYLRLNYNQA